LGPRQRAKSYFEELGFQCPPRQTTADFLTAVTDPYARVVTPGFSDKVPRTAEEFERCFQASVDAKSNFDAIASFENEVQSKLTAKMKEAQQSKADYADRSTFTMSFYKQVQACTIRQFQVLWGDKMSFVGKFILTTFISLVFGSLFYNQPATTSGVFTRGGVILYVLSSPSVTKLSFSLFFNSLLALSELTNAYSARQILLKHKLFTFYRPAAYALGQLVTDIPIIFVQVAIFDIIVYFLSHLSRTPSQFFINFFVLYINTMTMYTFFRMLGALSSSLDAATRISGISIQILVVYGGSSYSNNTDIRIYHPETDYASMVFLGINPFNSTNV
jgi:ATP-binding cassette, subfamily G (WHITE), member 2, SNQ2